jgi:hypothetical protein
MPLWLRPPQQVRAQVAQRRARRAQVARACQVSLLPRQVPLWPRLPQRRRGLGQVEPGRLTLLQVRACLEQERLAAALTWPLRGCLLLRLEQQLLGQEHLEVSGLRLQRLALL